MNHLLVSHSFAVLSCFCLCFCVCVLCLFFLLFFVRAPVGSRNKKMLDREIERGIGKGMDPLELADELFQRADSRKVLHAWGFVSALCLLGRSASHPTCMLVFVDHATCLWAKSARKSTPLNLHKRRLAPGLHIVSKMSK